MLQTTICVTDANFWIDLDVAGLLAIPFQLPCHWVSPDLVVAELVQTDGQYIVSLGLEVMELSGVESNLCASPAFPNARIFAARTCVTLSTRSTSR